VRRKLRITRPEVQGRFHHSQTVHLETSSHSEEVRVEDIRLAPQAERAGRVVARRVVQQSVEMPVARRRKDLGAVVLRQMQPWEEEAVELARRVPAAAVVLDL
jgi:hypothetical protein